jgi:hypothetical protein
VRAEADGYDGLQVAETRHVAFVGLTLAARATHAIELHSGIAVAFARNPQSSKIHPEWIFVEILRMTSPLVRGHLKGGAALGSRTPDLRITSDQYLERHSFYQRL